MPEELPLEPDLIKVLAADTRREILGQLRDRRMTVTELSEELELGKATVHEHLNKLTEADLVQRDEDDRLWVYYELTGRGKRLLNPQRTRFYLALASGLVAALVAGLAVYAFMMTGGLGGAGAPEEAYRAQEQFVTPTAEEVYADDTIEVPARLSGDGDVQAYLVDEDSASKIREGNLDVQGLPMRAYTPTTAEEGDVQARDETTLLRADASLQPGTYYLYVRSPEGDNAERMPSVRLLGIEASLNRSTWHQHLDRGPLEIRVQSSAEPLAGSLRLVDPGEGASPTVPLREGRAELGQRTLDQLAPGSYRVSVQPDDRDRWLSTETSLEVRPGQVALFPLHASEATQAPIQLLIDGPDRLLEPVPSVPGPHTVHEVEGGWRIDLQPREPGPVSLSLARTSRTVAVHAAVDIEATVHDGPEVHWNLSRLDGQPVAEAAVYLDGRAAGFTDANGTLVTDLPEEGPHRLSVHRPDGAVVTRAITVDGWRIQAPSPSVSVTPVGVDAGAQTVQVTVEVSNRGPVEQPVTVLAKHDDSPVASQGLEVPAGDSARANLTVPADAGRQQLTVEAEPLAPSPFRYANETTQEDSGSGDTSEDTNATADTDDGAAMETGTGGGSGETTVYLEESEEAADAVADGGQTSKLEPIRGTAREAGDGADAVGDAEAAEGQQTPGPGAILALALLTLAAVAAARRRKP